MARKTAPAIPETQDERIARHRAEMPVGYEKVQPLDPYGGPGKQPPDPSADLPPEAYALWNALVSDRAKARTEAARVEKRAKVRAEAKAEKGG